MPAERPQISLPPDAWIHRVPDVPLHDTRLGLSHSVDWSVTLDNP